MLQCVVHFVSFQDIVCDPQHPKYVIRVYCGHLYHYSCLDTYMKTPPFQGGWVAEAVGGVDGLRDTLGTDPTATAVASSNVPSMYYSIALHMEIHATVLYVPIM